MEITGDKYRSEQEEYISTADVDQRLTVKAVSVEENRAYKPRPADHPERSGLTPR
jgi:hypothetical protein